MTVLINKSFMEVLLFLNVKHYPKFRFLDKKLRLKSNFVSAVKIQTVDILL